MGNFIKQEMGKTYSVFLGINLVKKLFFLKSKMNSVARSTVLGRRFFGTGRVLRSEPTEVHPVFKKHKVLQQQFQQDNGLVIHLKAGARDKVYFYATTGLLFAVIGGTVTTWYEMAMKGR